MLWWATRKKKTSVLIWHLKGHHCAPACEMLLVWLVRRDAGKSDIRAERHPRACWFFYVQSHCVFMSPVWATIVSIWKNGFGEAVPQQSGSGAVYVTGMLMQLLHWGWSWTNGNGTTVFTRWANGKYVTSCHVQLQNECANIFSKHLGVVHILYNIKS